jgi:transposase
MEIPVCQGCRERDLRISQLEAQVKTLLQRIDKLEAKLGRNSGNSSVPPSANPLDAPKPPPKERSGRKAGGQPGHSAQTRVRLAPELVSRTKNIIPKNCEKCQHPLSAEAGPGDPEPLWHQVVELPKVLVDVTEYLAHGRTCPDCSHVTQATISADLRAHGYGPRFTAVVSALSGAFHVSKRDVEAIVETIIGVPIALGTIIAAEQETSAALANAHAEAAVACQQAAVNNIDETSWKLGKKLCWLWTAVSATCTYYLIHAKRSTEALNALFKTAFKGIVTSDRWVVYNCYDVYRRQLCWAHLIRDFQAMYERKGPSKRIGAALLGFTEDVFTLWYCVRDGTLSRSAFRRKIDAQRPWLREWLAKGATCSCAKTAALCTNLLKWEPSLWTFTRIESVEPTNNAAERALRKAVIWRKRSFGCKSEAGCRFVERILTVAKTLQQNQRPLLDYLVESITATRKGQPTPKLLPA